MKIPLVLFLLIAFATGPAYGQTLINPGDSVQVQCSICPACPVCPPERLPEIKIVDPLGSGDYTTIRQATDASQPGWMILVKNGTYNTNLSISTSGTPVQPITLMPYPGHNPVIDFSTNAGSTARIKLEAEWWIIEGFEITGSKGSNGIDIRKGNNTIRNNYIHDNAYSGIEVQSVSGATTADIVNTVIENNVIEHNGIGTGKCLYNSVESPKMCHGVYFSTHKFCTHGINNGSVKNNEIRNHGGAGIQLNGNSCGTTGKIQSLVLEGNRIEGNAWGIAFWHNAESNTVKDNTFRIHSWPVETDNDKFYMVRVNNSPSNAFTGNVFYSRNPNVWPLKTDTVGDNSNAFNNNLWKVTTNIWYWQDVQRSDWMNYKSVTGWGPNSDICITCN